MDYGDFLLGHGVCVWVGGKAAERHLRSAFSLAPTKHQLSLFIFSSALWRHSRLACGKINLHMQIGCHNNSRSSVNKYIFLWIYI